MFFFFLHTTENFPFLFCEPNAKSAYYLSSIKCIFKKLSIFVCLLSGQCEQTGSWVWFSEFVMNVFNLSGTTARAKEVLKNNKNTNTVGCGIYNSDQ